MKLLDSDKDKPMLEHAICSDGALARNVWDKANKEAGSKPRDKNTFRCFFIYLLGLQRRVRHKEKYVELLHLDATGDAVEVALSLRGDLAAVHATELALGLASAGGSSGGAEETGNAKQKQNVRKTEKTGLTWGLQAEQCTARAVAAPSTDHLTIVPLDSSCWRMVRMTPADDLRNFSVRVPLRMRPPK